MLKNSKDIGLTTAELVAKQQAALGINDHQLAISMGYTEQRVVTLMKSGQMRIPLDKAYDLAQALNLDEGTVMRMLLSESAPDLLHAFERCMGPLSLSPAEKRLIATLRQHSQSNNCEPIIYERDAVAAMIVIA